MRFLSIRLTAAALVVAFASACSEIEGATPALTSSGPVTPANPATQISTSTDQSGKAVCTANALRRDQFGLFQLAYACAWHEADKTVRGSTDFGNTNGERAYRTLLREGLGLIRANCADFFRERGDRQQTVNFLRDVVAIGGTTAGSIVGVSGGSVLAMTIIALTGATLYGGLDVYTKNFLFGVENIESVRTLTMQTLSDNASQLMAAPPPLSFQGVAGALADNQDICKPSSIAAAVRLKLRGGSGGVEAAGESINARNQLDAARAAAINALMGATPGVVLDETRLAAACWATTPDGMDVGNSKYVQSFLLPKVVYPNGPGNPINWPGVSVRVAGECASLSPTMQNTIKTRVSEFRVLVQKAAAASSGANSTPSTVLPSEQGLQPFVPTTVR